MKKIIIIMMSVVMVLGSNVNLYANRYDDVAKNTIMDIIIVCGKHLGYYTKVLRNPEKYKNPIEVMDRIDKSLYDQLGGIKSYKVDKMPLLTPKWKKMLETMYGFISEYAKTRENPLLDKVEKHKKIGLFLIDVMDYAKKIAPNLK